MSVKANPLPENGVVGLLTGEQTSALRQFWKELFELVDNAPKQGNTNPASANAPRADEEQLKKNTPKDDAAKEKQRQLEEMANARLAFEQYGSERFMQTFWRFVAMDHPDSICLKFMRARKWNPTAGVAMFAACMKWRIESGVEDIFTKGEEGLQHGQGFLFQMTAGKAYIGCSDRHGRPVLCVHVALHKGSDQSPKALEDFVLFQMESIRAFAHGTVDKVTLLFDMTSFGLSNMDWRVVSFITKCLEAYYPESLNVILVHKAPWVFQGIWKILAPLLDPVVRAKVQMTKNTEDLFVHIPEAHLPSKLGGQNSWTWRYPAIIPGENKAMEDTPTKNKLQAERDQLCAEFDAVSRRWATSNDTEIDNQRDFLAKRMRSQYLTLDPFIRGRGAYHRIGNIVGNGLVCFKYPDAHGMHEGEYEVLGQAGSKEALDLGIERKIGRKNHANAKVASPSTPKKPAAFKERQPSEAQQSQGTMSQPFTPANGSLASSTRGSQAPPGYATSPSPSTSTTSFPTSSGADASPELSQSPSKTVGTSPSLSSISKRSQLRQRFSSGPGSILRIKGTDRRVVSQDGSVA